MAVRCTQIPSSFDDGRVGWLEPEIKNVPGKRCNMLTIERRSGHVLAARSAAADTGFVSIRAVRAFLGALLDQTQRPSAGIGAVSGNPIRLNTGASLSTSCWHGRHSAA